MCIRDRAGLGIWFVSGDILHAATHYSIFSSQNANLMVGWLVGWVHHVPSMWIRQHVLSHHLYTNIPGLDPDLDHFRQFAKLQSGWRLSTDQNHRSQYTNWRRLFFPIVAVTGIGPLIGETLQALASGWYMRRTKLQLVPRELALSVMQLGTVVLLGIALPLFLNGSIMHLLIPYAVHGTVYYGFASASHTNQSSQSQVSADGTLVDSSKPGPRSEWAAHQIETSKGDYAPTSIVWGLLSLGLNNQAIHHVFPGVHPCHYYKLAPIVRRVCDKHKVEYHTFKTLWHSLGDHVDWIKFLNDAPAGKTA
eukprot:TRINITY_DN1750_c0_g1_i2.p1 TRINITY_DN1750_c0_g1~~TRINITY_DN1750_c0_g1_i2.p1  ORF type:complete len:307 (+),score=64.31 TRINITY_DN1750_c0_g1_i2:170-1090(+)